MKKFGNPGTVMPRYARGSPAQCSCSVRPSRPTTRQAREVVRGLEPGRHHDHVDRRARRRRRRRCPVGVTDATAFGTSSTFVLLQCGIERAREHRAACPGYGYVGVTAAARSGRSSNWRAMYARHISSRALAAASCPGCQIAPLQQVLLQQVLQPQPFARRRHGSRTSARSSSVKSRSPFGSTQPGSRWNT